MMSFSRAKRFSYSESPVYLSKSLSEQRTLTNANTDLRASLRGNKSGDLGDARCGKGRHFDKEPEESSEECISLKRIDYRGYTSLLKTDELRYTNLDDDTKEKLGLDNSLSSTSDSEFYDALSDIKDSSTQIRYTRTSGYITMSHNTKVVRKKIQELQTRTMNHIRSETTEKFTEMLNEVHKIHERHLKDMNNQLLNIVSNLIEKSEKTKAEEKLRNENRRLKSEIIRLTKLMEDKENNSLRKWNKQEHDYRDLLNIAKKKILDSEASIMIMEEEIKALILKEKLQNTKKLPTK